MLAVRGLTGDGTVLQAASYERCRRGQGDSRTGDIPVTDAAGSNEPSDREKAFDALGTSVVEEYGEWKPEGPADGFLPRHV